MFFAADDFVIYDFSVAVTESAEINERMDESHLEGSVIDGRKGKLDNAAQEAALVAGLVELGEGITLGIGVEQAPFEHAVELAVGHGELHGGATRVGDGEYLATVVTVGGLVSVHLDDEMIVTARILVAIFAELRNDKWFHDLHD